MVSDSFVFPFGLGAARTSGGGGGGGGGGGSGGGGGEGGESGGGGEGLTPMALTLPGSPRAFELSSPVLSPLRGMASKVFGDVGRSFRESSAAATAKQEVAVPEAGQWELLWAQELMYDRWREAEPQTVQALEKLTAAVVRDAKTRVHPDYIRFSLQCSVPLRASAILRTVAPATEGGQEGRHRTVERVRIFSDQFAFRARRTQGDRTQIEWIFGPRSVAILPSELINKLRMCEIAGKRLEDLRVREEVRATQRPSPVAAAQPGGGPVAAWWRPGAGVAWRPGVAG